MLPARAGAHAHTNTTKETETAGSSSLLWCQFMFGFGLALVTLAPLGSVLFLQAQALDASGCLSASVLAAHHLWLAFLGFLCGLSCFGLFLLVCKVATLLLLFLWPLSAFSCVFRWF